MALELDPIYHTETMVRILREQGSSLLAMELAEKILQNNPENDSVRQLLGEMKEEARASFERFRQAGRTEDHASEPAEPATEPTDPTAKPREAIDVVPEASLQENILPDNVVALREVAPEPTPAPVKVLRRLLQRVQDYRNDHGR